MCVCVKERDHRCRPWWLGVIIPVQDFISSFCWLTGRGQHVIQLLQPGEGKWDPQIKGEQIHFNRFANTYHEQILRNAPIATVCKLLKKKKKKGRRNWLPPSSLSVFAWNLIFKLDILKLYETINMPVAGRTLSQYCVMRDTFKFIIVWKLWQFHSNQQLWDALHFINVKLTTLQDKQAFPQRFFLQTRVTASKFT